MGECWERVRCAMTVPAGQPWRETWTTERGEVFDYRKVEAESRVIRKDWIDGDREFYIDSSWRPPLPQTPNSVIEARSRHSAPRRVICIRQSYDREYPWRSGDGGQFMDSSLELIRVIHEEPAEAVDDCAD